MCMTKKDRAICGTMQFNYQYLNHSVTSHEMHEMVGSSRAVRVRLWVLKVAGQYLYPKYGVAHSAIND